MNFDEKQKELNDFLAKIFKQTCFENGYENPETILHGQPNSKCATVKQMFCWVISKNIHKTKFAHMAMQRLKEFLNYKSHQSIIYAVNKFQRKYDEHYELQTKANRLVDYLVTGKINMFHIEDISDERKSEILMDVLDEHRLQHLNK